MLPTGEGLFAVRDLDEAAAAVEAIAADPARHRRAAAEIAREHFDAERVLAELLEPCRTCAAPRRGPARPPAGQRHRLGTAFHACWR